MNARCQPAMIPPSVHIRTIDRAPGTHPGRGRTTDGIAAARCPDGARREAIIGRRRATTRFLALAGMAAR